MLNEILSLPRVKNYSTNKSTKLSERIIAYRLKHYCGLLKFLKVGCQIFTSWPMNSAPRWIVVLSNTLCIVYLTSQVLGTIAVANGLRCCYGTLFNTVVSFMDTMFLFETFFNILYYRMRAKKFQRLICEMENFFAMADPRELSQLTLVYYTLSIIYIIAASLFIFSPLVIANQYTPMNTVYPVIPRGKFWGRCITYAWNVFHIAADAYVVLLDILVISVMWHCACKFKLLRKKLDILNENEMRMWINEHQRAIRYVHDVNSVMAPLAVKSTVTVALDMIISGTLMINNIPIMDQSKFIAITIFSMLRIFACSWAADAMTQQAQNIAWGVYSSPWFETTPSLRRWGVIIIQRCQKPITIHSTFFLKAWSLKFCGHVIYGLVQFFSTLKAALRGQKY